jgi:neutral trehalase
MLRAVSFSALVLCVCAATQCAAQDLPIGITPTIRLSSDESATAKRVTDQLKKAQDRATAAEERLDAFRKTFRQAHAQLLNPVFSPDFVAAYDIPDDRSWAPTATTVELTSDERRDAQAVYDELKASQEAVKTARKNWQDFQNELLVKHVQAVVPKRAGVEAADAVTVITLPDGQQYIVPDPWWRGIALTPDFQTAIPR